MTARNTVPFNGLPDWSIKVPSVENMIEVVDEPNATALALPKPSGVSNVTDGTIRKVTLPSNAWLSSVVVPAGTSRRTICIQLVPTNRSCMLRRWVTAIWRAVLNCDITRRMAPSPCMDRRASAI